VKLKIPLFRRKYIISFFTIFFFLSTVLCGYASSILDKNDIAFNTFLSKSRDGISSIKEIKKAYKEYKKIEKEFRKSERHHEKKYCESFIKDNYKKIPKKQKKEIRKVFKNYIYAVKAIEKINNRQNNDVYRLAKTNKKAEMIRKKIKKSGKIFYITLSNYLKTAFEYLGKINVVRKDNNIAIDPKEKNELGNFIILYKNELIEATRKGDVKTFYEIAKKCKEDQKRSLANEKN
jgi:hypothetical protein